MTASKVHDVPQFEIVSTVLLKLDPEALPKLPLACTACPDALWQVTGKDTKAVKPRCFCPVMHVFTWGSKEDSEILDCEHLYKKEEDGDLPELDDEDVPPFLKEQQREKGATGAQIQEVEMAGQAD